MPGPGKSRHFDDATLAGDLRAVADAFVSRWRLIMFSVIAFVALGLVYIWLATPAYTSSVDIFIDPRERGLTDSDITPTGMGSSSQGADSALVDSQVSILNSRSVFTTLIERENLETDPQFGGAKPNELRELILYLPKMLVYGPNAEIYAQMSPFDRALDRLRRAVEIKRVGQTYVLNVSVTTPSAQQSARIANTLAEIYLAEGQQAGDASALESAQSMEARLAELQRQSAASQRAVEDYRREQGLIGSQGALTDERQLSDLTSQLVSASVATKTARAALDEVRRDGALASTSSLSSDIAAQLRMQLDRAASDENVLAATYGDRHPRLVQARETRLSLQRALDAELRRITKRADSDYKKAVQTEKSLQALLARYEERLAISNVASVKLRELEEVAARDRSLYDSFATRARQAREQVALPTTTARIISAAQPASRPSEPKAAAVLAISVFLGLVAGFGTAWVLHLLSDPRRTYANVDFSTIEQFRRAAE